MRYFKSISLVVCVFLLIVLTSLMFSTSTTAQTGTSVTIRDKTNPSRTATVDTSGNLKVTGTVNPGNTANTTPWLVDISATTGLTADAAEGSAATNNPTPVSGKARTSELAAIAAGTQGQPTLTTTAIPLHWGPALPQDTGYYYANVTDDDEDTIKAGVASTYLCVTSVFVQNADASTAATYSFKSDTGGTVIFAGYAGTSGGGFARGDGNSPIFCTAVGKGLYGIASAHANLHVQLKYFRTLLAPSY